MADNPGRARGRARGRGRGGPGGSGGDQGARPPPGFQPPPPQQQRGPEARPGAPAAGLTSAVAALRVTEEASSGRGNRRGNGRQVAEVHVRTKPPNMNTKKGTSGTPIKLISNYFKILTKPNWCLYQYRVDIVPEEDRTFVRKSLLRDHGKTFGGFIFDGTVLFTPHRLEADPLVLHSKRREDDMTMKLTIKLVGDLVPGDHHYIQVFNILMRRCYEYLDLQLVGRDYFDPRAKIDIREHKLQIWPGYKTTIAQYENSLMMVAEITHKVMRLDTVLDCLRGNNHDIQAFTAAVVGQVVLTDYNNKTYTIDDVDWQVNPTSTFNMKGEDVSYIDYYKKKYQLTIRDMKQPLLISRAKARDIRAGMSEFVYLIPELCRMTGLSETMKSNFQLMKAMSAHTRVGPENRIQRLLGFNSRLQTTQACVKDLKDWDMTLEKKLVEIPARQLPQETILQGKDRKYMSGDTNDGWTRELRNKPMLSSANITKWAVIIPQRCKREADGFVQMIIKAGQGMGLNWPNPSVVDIPNDNIPVYLDALERTISTMNPNIIVCMVTNDRPERYSAIKKKCCVDRGVPSQVITARAMNNKNAMSIATKVVIQMNCKTGGAPWSVPIPLAGLMVVGFDVCHDASNKNKSYGAMVASLDNAMSRYFNAVTPHTNGEELSNQFSMNIKKALQKYKEVNGSLPTRVLIYRDGVGEGQIPYVYEHEVEFIKTSLNDMYGGAGNYKMGFIVVTKRLNTRFFQASTEGNPKPGTVIDDVVTSPERYDFFLVSQAVREGTVAPTSYNVLFDNLGLNPDQIQRLTYKYTHLYFNFSGQVRVPAPCQYAHKLAFLTGQNLHMAPNIGLDASMFYL